MRRREEEGVVVEGGKIGSKNQMSLNPERESELSGLA